MGSEGQECPSLTHSMADKNVCPTDQECPSLAHSITDKNECPTADGRIFPVSDPSWKSVPKRLRVAFWANNVAGWLLIVWVFQTRRHGEFSPLWLTVLSLPLGLSFFFAWRADRWQKRFKRKQAGLCFNCGYDLRATRDRCPECGAI